VESHVRNVRQTLRSLGRAPGFTAAAVLTLALGIGANAAIFSAVHAVLLRPLPYPAAERLMVVWLDNRAEGIERDVTSYPTFEDWRAASAFEAMAAYTGWSATLTGAGDAEQVRGALVTGDFFRVLGVPAVQGRALGAADVEEGAGRVAVLSHALWSGRFGADPTLIGQTITINGAPVEVVGVMPRGFNYPEDAMIWSQLGPATMSPTLLAARGSLWLSVVGRLQPGAGPARAQTKLDGVMARLIEAEPDQAGNGAFVEPLHDTVVGSVRPALLLLLGAVGFVLLIACTNVANLLLVRGAARRREMAVRTALGASGRQLAAQTLTESTVLAVLGGVAGVLLAAWATGLLTAFGPPEIPRLDAVRVDGTVVAFSALLSIATGLIFGLLPALHAARTSPASTLREGGRGVSGARSDRARPVLVAAEVALALMLLIGAGLLIRSFVALQSERPGYETERTLSFRVTLGGARYAEEAVNPLQTQLLERIRTLPDVEAATLITNLQLGRLPNMGPISVEGRPPPQPGDAVTSVTRDMADAGFFTAMRIPLVAGRDLTEDDRADGLPVAVVNETFVRRFFPGESAVGRRFTWSDPTDPESTWLTIVGVSADTRRAGPVEPVRPEAVLARMQEPARGTNVLVRTSGDPLYRLEAVRGVVRELDPDLPLAAVTTLERAQAEQLAARRFILLLLAGFAGAAVLLAAIGIYGVLSYTVTQRTRELGIRLALGAERRTVLTHVLGQAMRQVLPGVAIGVAGALALTGVIRSQLHGVEATDPATFAAVVLLMIGVSLLASWLPARRAARVEPAVTLRNE
jgi:putative ABC transport system permease protein